MVYLSVGISHGYGLDSHLLMFKITLGLKLSFFMCCVVLPYLLDLSKACNHWTTLTNAGFSLKVVYYVKCFLIYFIPPGFDLNLMATAMLDLYADDTVVYTYSYAL